MSTISAGTSTGTALVSTGDTTGALVFKTGAGATTAMTIGADQSVTFAGTVYGLGGGGATPSGSVVLTATSAGAQAITTTGYGQTVTLPDATTLSEGGALYNINNLGAYPLKIVNNAGSTLGFVYSNCPVTAGLADNSTAAGTWNLIGAEPYAVVAQTTSSALQGKTAAATARKVVVIDANRTLVILGNTNIYGIIYNASTRLWGTLTTIRTGSGVDQIEAILSATDQVLVNSSINAAMEAVVLTLSDTAITVGTAATATLSANNGGNATSGNLVAVGSSFVITYEVTALQMRAMTISGTTVTIGSATVLNGTNSGATSNIYLAAASSSVALVLTNTAASTFFATPYTISGTTITLGTGATYASVSADGYIVRPISSGVRWAVVIQSSVPSVVGFIISVASTTATISSVTVCAAGGTSDAAVIVSGSKLIFCGSPNAGINILTDSAGTASAGTEITSVANSAASKSVIPISANATTNLATFSTQANDGSFVTRIVVNFSGSSPTLVNLDSQTGEIESFPDTVSDFNYKQTNTPNVFNGAISYSWDNSTTGTRAVAIGENCFYSFMPKLVPANIATSWNSISPNKVLIYDPTFGGSTNDGGLQIVESVS